MLAPNKVSVKWFESKLNEEMSDFEHTNIGKDFLCSIISNSKRWDSSSGIPKTVHVVQIAADTNYPISEQDTILYDGRKHSVSDVSFKNHAGTLSKKIKIITMVG